MPVQSLPRVPVPQSTAVPPADLLVPAVPPADDMLNPSNSRFTCKGFTSPAAVSGDALTAYADLIAAASPPPADPHAVPARLPPSALDARAYPTVGFRAPILGLISTRAKSLDMRPVTDASTASLRPGSLFWGYQGGANPFVRLCRVLRVRTFASTAAAFTFYQDRGEDASLFPPGWCLHEGRPIRSAADADAFFACLTSRRTPATASPAVRVLTLAPVDEAAETSTSRPTAFPLRFPSRPP